MSFQNLPDLTNKAHSKNITSLYQHDQLNEGGSKSNTIQANDFDNQSLNWGQDSGRMGRAYRIVQNALMNTAILAPGQGHHNLLTEHPS